MARAKRTDRAEARRRYRAATDTDPFESADEATSTSPTKAPRSSSAPPPKSTGTLPRMSMAAAFKASIRPLNVREDIAALPSIAIHSKALWVPVLITVVSTVAVLVTGGTDTVSAFLFAYFVQTPAIGGVFIAGFLAPRASWLLGVIVGFVAAVGYSIVIVIETGRGTAIVGNAQVQDAIIAALILSPILGAFFAASAAWYRRFLALSNPNRGRQSRGQPQKKVGDGKTRSGGSSQKAGVRR